MTPKQERELIERVSLHGGSIVDLIWRVERLECFSVSVGSPFGKPEAEKPLTSRCSDPKCMCNFESEYFKEAEKPEVKPTDPFWVSARAELRLVEKRVERLEHRHAVEDAIDKPEVKPTPEPDPFVSIRDDMARCINGEPTPCTCPDADEPHVHQIPPEPTYCKSDCNLQCDVCVEPDRPQPTPTEQETIAWLSGYNAGIFVHSQPGTISLCHACRKIFHDPHSVSIPRDVAEEFCGFGMVDYNKIGKVIDALRKSMGEK